MPNNTGTLVEMQRDTDHKVEKIHERITKLEFGFAGLAIISIVTNPYVGAAIGSLSHMITLLARLI